MNILKEIEHLIKKANSRFEWVDSVLVKAIE